MILNKKTTDYQQWQNAIPDTGGVVLIDKEKDWTSFDVCAKLRGILRTKKVGHAGTLDPLATGLLIVCCGKATKTINDYQSLEKEYRALIKLGATTKTDDAEADEENITATDTISDDLIIEAVNSFIGKIQQRPPMFSAKKVNGQRLYKLARKGETIEVAPSEVEIYSIVINNIENPIIDITIRCSKGTYIRALARDIGTKLNCGGYLKELRRTAIGEHQADDAYTIEELNKLVNTENE